MTLESDSGKKKSRAAPTQQQIEQRIINRARRYHKKFAELERSKYPPQGWNPGFHGPGECTGGNVFIVADTKEDY